MQTKHSATLSVLALAVAALAIGAALSLISGDRLANEPTVPEPETTVRAGDEPAGPAVIHPGEAPRGLPMPSAHPDLWRYGELPYPEPALAPGAPSPEPVAISDEPGVPLADLSPILAARVTGSGVADGSYDAVGPLPELPVDTRRTVPRHGVVRTSDGPLADAPSGDRSRAATPDTAMGSQAGVTLLAPADGVPTPPQNAQLDNIWPQRVNISWDPPAQQGAGIATYQIYRNGSLLAIVAGTETSYSDQVVDPATNYLYTVVAVENGSGDESDPSSVIVASTPAQPLGVLSYEPFDYTQGQVLDGQAGGTGWSGAWVAQAGNTNDAEIVAPLTFTNLPTDGSAVVFSAGFSKALTYDRDMAAMAGVDGTSIWISILIEETKNNLRAKWALQSGGSDVLALTREDVGNWFWEDPSDKVDTGIGPRKDQTAFWLARIDFKAGEDLVNVWHDYAGLPDEPPPAPLQFAVDDFTFDGVSLFGTGIIFDEVRIGNTYNDVIGDSGPLDGWMLIEAEDFDRQVDDTDVAWVVTNDGTASAGAYVEVPDATWAKGNARPILEYDIDFPEAGEYQILLQCHAPNSRADSLYYALDGGAFAYSHIHVIRPWSWTGNAFMNNYMRVDIASPGVHTLRLMMREDGFRLDRMSLSKLKGYTLDGLASATHVESGGSVSFPAEEYHSQFVTSPDGRSPALGGIWGATADGGALDGVAMRVPDMGNYSFNGKIGARLDYQVDFSAAGTYLVELRVNSPSSSSNSVHVGINDWVTTGNLYSLGVGGFDFGNWAWVDDYTIGSALIEVPSAGVHTFSIWVREDGTMIDHVNLILQPTSSI